jgi:hypothetical protein
MTEKQTNTMAEGNQFSRTANAESDQLALACRRLTTSRYVTLRRVSCRQEADFLVLRGEVPSFYLKQLAQEVVRNVVPGGRIRNLLEVTANTG